MKEEKKYTLGEAALGIFGGGFIAMFLILLVIPIDLALAWLRTQVWNWFFVPYLHAPQMSVWLMFAIILFISMFRKGPRDLKKEYYESSTWSSIIGAWILEGIAFLILFGVHLWVLKG